MKWLTPTTLLRFNHSPPAPDDHAGGYWSLASDCLLVHVRYQTQRSAGVLPPSDFAPDRGVAQRLESRCVP